MRSNIILDAPTAAGFVGSTIVFLSVFAPIVTAPLIGDVNYLQSSLVQGVIVMLAGAFSAWATARRNFKHLWFSGTAALGVPLFTFTRFQLQVNDLKRQMAQMKDSPFAGFADSAMKSVHVRWGLALLIVGGLLLFAAAAISRLQARRN